MFFGSPGGWHAELAEVEVMGKSLGNTENPMENHGKLWKIMEDYGKPWKIPWKTMENPMENHGKSHGKSWKIMENYLGSSENPQRKWIRARGEPVLIPISKSQVVPFMFFLKGKTLGSSTK